MSQDLVFVEQFYYPDGWAGAQLPRDVTVHLRRAGYAVEVICGSDPYAAVEGDPGPDPRRAGVHIRRISRVLGGDIHRHKLLRQLWFCVAALPLLLLRGRPAAFIAQTNPPLIVPVAALAALLHRAPLVIVAMDLYPEVLIANGTLRPDSVGASVLRVLFRWAYRRASRVVALGPVMARRLEEKGVDPRRIVEISNWATGDETVVRGPGNRLRSAWGLDGRFVVMYSGNIGIAHDVETPIRAAVLAAREAPGLRLLFVGKGSRLAEARRIAERMGAGDVVQFQGLVPTELLPHSLGVADLALVTLRAGFEGLVVPSKLLGYLARGVPVLYVGPPSDAQELVERSGAGRCVPNDDPGALAALFVAISRDSLALGRMSESGVTFYERELAQARGLERYRKMIDDLLRPPSGGSAA
jgi:glycosyltransferase involved in cell wall biosynthesis